MASVKPGGVGMKSCLLRCTAGVAEALQELSCCPSASLPAPRPDPGSSRSSYGPGCQRGAASQKQFLFSSAVLGQQPWDNKSSSEQLGNSRASLSGFFILFIGYFRCDIANEVEYFSLNHLFNNQSEAHFPQNFPFVLCLNTLA